MTDLIDPCPQCRKNEAGEDNECPYEYEINGEIVICRCCDECRDNCLGEI